MSTLLDRIDGTAADAAEPLLLACELVERGSVAPPAG
jgi:DNA-binding LacI/PurR family transcriptional regulator